MNKSLLAFILLIIGIFDIVAAVGSKVPMGQKAFLILVGAAFLGVALMTVLNEKKRRENEKHRQKSEK